jgi:aminopeptidase
MPFRCLSLRVLLASASVLLAACNGGAPAANAPAVDQKAVAKTLVQAAMIKPGDKVLVTGSLRDAALLDDIAVEAMKAGGQPLISIGSDELTRRSFDEVPASYDTQPQTLSLGLANMFDAQISVEVGDAENVMVGVPPARMAARAKAGLAANEAALKRGVRSVNLGNGLYPTASLAGHLSMSQTDLAKAFWAAANVPPATLRTKGEAIRAALSAAKQVTISAANGTSITFSLNTARASVSDGAITPEKVNQGGSATTTWLPAGELLVPVAPGTAEGKVVVDKLVYQGATIQGLTMTFSKGKLTGMTATSGLDALKALYDVSSGGKDQFSYIDLGLNPEVKLPTNTGRIVWMAAGAVTVGLGDNTAWGGSIVSEFGLATPISGATLKADATVLIENGVLK